MVDAEATPCQTKAGRCREMDTVANSTLEAGDAFAADYPIFDDAQYRARRDEPLLSIHYNDARR